MAKFAVGEIAVLTKSHNNDLRFINSEVEVVSEPYVHRKTGRYGYNVIHPVVKSTWFNGSWFAPEAWLRKRPQPPDWNALSDPRRLPIEELA